MTAELIAKRLVDHADALEAEITAVSILFKDPLLGRFGKYALLSFRLSNGNAGTD
jgi:hypothetical protein